MDNRNAFNAGFVLACVFITVWAVMCKLAKRIDSTTRRVNRLSSKLDRYNKELREFKPLKSYKKVNYPMGK